MSRQPLSREAIVAAAIRRLDEDGLAAFSVRKVAKDLGFEAMSLYRYFANKEAMLDAVHAAVLAEIPVPKSSADWKTDARQMANGLLDGLLAHPGCIALLPTRPAFADGALPRLEASVRILKGSGLPDSLRLSALQSLHFLVVGYALAESSAAGAPDFRDLSPSTYSNLRRLPVPASRQGFRQALDLWIRGVDHSAPKEEAQSLGDRLRSFRIR